MDYKQISGLITELNNKLNISGDNTSSRSTFNDNIGNKVFATISERDAFTPKIRDTAFVVDASGDSSVDSGWAFYKYYNTGSESQWVLLMKQNSVGEISGTEIVTKLDSLESTNRLSLDSLKEGTTNLFFTSTIKNRHDALYNKSVYGWDYEVLSASTTISQTDDTSTTISSSIPILLESEELSEYMIPIVFVNTDFFPYKYYNIVDDAGSLAIQFDPSVLGLPYDILSTWDITIYYPILTKNAG